jgi:glucan phosphoethanolaminetransferase (alkaline phosphatase superfamily)
MDQKHRRRMTTAALLAAVAAAATDFAYVVLIVSQGATPPQPGIVPFVIGYIAAIAAAALIGMWSALFGRPSAAKAVFLAAAAGSAALGFIGIFSIGLPLLITGALLSVAAQAIPAMHRPNPWLWPVAGAVIAIVVLIAGFVVAGGF